MSRSGTLCIPLDTLNTLPELEPFELELFGIDERTELDTLKVTTMRIWIHFVQDGTMLKQLAGYRFQCVNSSTSTVWVTRGWRAPGIPRHRG